MSPVSWDFTGKKLEAPPGFEPGMEVLQTSALPLGDGADDLRGADCSAGVRLPFDSLDLRCARVALAQGIRLTSWPAMSETSFRRRRNEVESNGAGNGIRTRDFDLGKVAL